MTGRRRLDQTMRRLDLQKANRNQHIPGLLGTPLGGQEVVEVAGRANFVWVRLRDNQSELIQAFNREISPVFNLPVLIRRDELDPSRYEVVDIDRGRYDNWGGSSFVPKHAGQHMFNPDAPGGDIVWAYDRQLMPLLVHPSGTAGACNAVVEPDVYYQDGQWKYGGGTGTPDLCAFVPTGTFARMVLVYLDSAANPQLVAGDYFSPSITGTAQVLPFVPTLPTTSSVPLAWVRLVSGTERVLWENLYDARPWIVGDGVLSTGTARHIIQDEGSNEADRPILNFTGDIVFVEDDGGSNRTNIIFSGSAGGGGDGHTIQDEGTPVTQRSALNFMGSTVYVEDDSGNDRTNVIVSGSAGGSVDFASKAEAEAGVVTDKAIAPATLPIIMPDGGLLRTDETSTGNARGGGAVDFQRDRGSANQVASGFQSAIISGFGNRNDGYTSLIFGDENVDDVGNAEYNLIFGNGNYASGTSAGLIGGYDNIAGGSNLDTPFVFGEGNRILGVQRGWATGDGAASFLHGMEARTLSGVGDGHDQRIMLNLYRLTSNATPAEMVFPNSSRMVLRDRSAWAFTILLSAKNRTTSTQAAGYEFKGVIQRDVGVASAALVGSVTKTVLGESDSNWDADVDADTTNGSLRITVTGAASQTIDWYASLIAAVSGN